MFGERIFREDRTWRRERRASSFHKGDLKYLLLYMIKDKPQHGYEIIRELEEQSYGFYKPSPGVIYPTLQMLEEMGYATSSEADGKKVYQITEEGRKFLDSKKGMADDLKSHIKHNWKFKHIGRIARIMAEYHNLEHLLGRCFRRLDADKTERIGQVLSRTYREIETIIEE